MARIDRILKNLKSANVLNETLIVNVSEENIFTVLSSESTAVVTTPQNLKQYKSIIIICNSNVIAIAAIREIRQYNSDMCKNMWGNKTSWNSIIEFYDVVLLGDSVDNIFGNISTIKNTQTVNYLKTANEVVSLINAINMLYSLLIKSYLSNIGIE